jgi:pimeloyl-ACP methyl ester carboxylesterase
LLRGTPEQFRQAIDMVFDSLTPPLTGDELARVRSGSRPDQEVVLGTWSVILDGDPQEVDAGIAGLVAGVGDRPYLALHGIDPGPGYAQWLQARLPQATVEVWPDHGHYPMLVDQPRFLTRLAAFEDEVRAT